MTIVTRLRGGIGNQMFQYAMGLAQAKRWQTDLLLDISSFVGDSLRRFNLNLFPRVNEKTVIGYVKATISESGMPYNKAIVDSIKCDEILSGYWQTEKYFSWDALGSSVPFGDIKQDLFSIFTDVSIQGDYYHRLNRIKSVENSIAVCIRRTDYLKSDFHGVLPAEYYRTAAKFINAENPTFFVFSDEPKWCEQNFTNIIPDVPFEIMGSFDQTTPEHLGTEHLDINLMSWCRHHIIANSTFAWWGAWLGEIRQKGIICAPSQWFLNAPENPKDIIPERWIKL
ncbi:MAG TPA: alpha-1,2-fucosyltransferase [Candidatus Paceibacterota bacterium]|jgi:hypothetical protein|nr:alpha-1,2-fucosyltransferase [Candidatus Paceibacterota bacterium]